MYNMDAKQYKIRRNSHERSYRTEGRDEEKTEKARRKQLLIRLGTAVGVVALLIALALIFQVRTIHITGNSFLTKEEILQYIEKQGEQTIPWFFLPGPNLDHFRFRIRQSRYSLP